MGPIVRRSTVRNGVGEGVGVTDSLEHEFRFPNDGFWKDFVQFVEGHVHSDHNLLFA